MKTIKISLIQGETEFTTEFQLNENQAKDLGIIVGTAINAVNRKLTLARQLGASILRLNKPCVVKLSADGINVDTSLLDAGIIGARKEFKMVLTPSATPNRQQVFARKMWAATQMLMQRIEVKHINEIMFPEVQTINRVEPVAIEAPVVLPAETQAALNSTNQAVISETLTGMQVAAHTIPGAKGNRKIRRAAVKEQAPAENANQEQA